MKKLFFFLGLMLTILAIVYFAQAVLHNMEFLARLEWGFPIILTLVATGMLQCLIIFLGAVSWFLLLKGMKEPAEITPTVTLFGLTQLAKYLPGNFGQHLSRAVLARSCGLRTHSVLFSIILETSCVLIAAVFVSSVALFAQGEALQALLPQSPPAWKLFLLVMVALVLPIGAARLYNRWGLRIIGQFWEISNLSFPSRPILLVCFSAYALSFLILAFMVEILGQEAFGVGSGHFARLTGIVTVAWMAGYIVPGAPAGFGVREAVLLSALTPLWGGPAAVGTAIFLRLVTTGGDGLVFLAALLERRRILPTTMD